MHAFKQWQTLTCREENSATSMTQHDFSELISQLNYNILTVVEREAYTNSMLLVAAEEAS